MAAVVRMEANGISSTEALSRAASRMGDDLAKSFNELVFFGEQIPPEIQTIVDLLVEVGEAQIDDQGFLVMAGAVEEVIEKAEKLKG